MRLFYSNFTNKVDRKGRVSLPAPFRTVITTAGHKEVVVYKHSKLGCLIGATPSFFEDLEARIDTTHGVDSDEYMALANISFAQSKLISFDPDEGRMVLPEDLRGKAGISDTAVFVGFGKTFQIWEPAAWAAQERQLEERARALEPGLKPVGRGEAS